MSLFDPPEPTRFSGWSCILERGTELEAQMQANFLRSRGVPVHVFSKRDTAYSLTIGEMSSVYVYVPEEFEKKALNLLRELEDPRD